MSSPALDKHGYTIETCKSLCVTTVANQSIILHEQIASKQLLGWDRPLFTATQNGFFFAWQILN